MTEFFMEYGLFLAKAITVVVAIGVLVATVILLSRRQGHMPETLEVTNLNQKYQRMALILKQKTLPKKDFRKAAKTQKAHQKEKAKKPKNTDDEHRKRIFIIDFHGDIKATAVASLREEITAILSEVKPDDEVLVRLENSGGLVHEHGLAASQLVRIKHKKIPLTIAVDKVAASGGYLMACVADHIIAAPFAIIGSIGVLAQLPNFHRLLDKHGIDFEQIKVGEFKRTLTMFGENSDADRAKVKAQLEDTHTLFKDFITEYRPGIEVAEVATGEYWHGKQALELKLVDELMTSDDYLLTASETADLYQVTYTARKRLSERLVSAIQQA